MSSSKSGGPRVELKDGFSMPLIAFGTGSTNYLPEILEVAITTGDIRHIDSAVSYGEQATGRILKRVICTGSGKTTVSVPRVELFVTSKLDPSDSEFACVLSRFSKISVLHRSLCRHENSCVDQLMHIQTQLIRTQSELNRKVQIAVVQSIKNLGAIGYLDLLLVHSAPMPERDPGQYKLICFYRAVWRLSRIRCRNSGDSLLVKSVGVSNFSVKSLEAIKKNLEQTVIHGADVVEMKMPVINQIQYNPFFRGMMGDRMLDAPTNPSPPVGSPQHTSIVDYCQQHGIVVTAYSSLQPLKVCPSQTLVSSERSKISKYWFTWRYLKRHRAWLPVGQKSNTSIKRVIDDYQATKRTMTQINTIGAMDLYRWHLGAGELNTCAGPGKTSARGVIIATSNMNRARALVKNITAGHLDSHTRSRLDRAWQWSDAFMHYMGFRVYFDDNGMRVATG